MNLEELSLEELEDLLRETETAAGKAHTNQMAIKILDHWDFV